MVKAPKHKQNYFKTHPTHKGNSRQQLPIRVFPVLTKKPRCNLKQLVIALVTKGIQVAWDLWSHINGIRFKKTKEQTVTNNIPRKQHTSY